MWKYIRSSSSPVLADPTPESPVTPDPEVQRDRQGSSGHVFSISEAASKWLHLCPPHTHHTPSLLRALKLTFRPQSPESQHNDTPPRSSELRQETKQQNKPPDQESGAWIPDLTLACLPSLSQSTLLLEASVSPSLNWVWSRWVAPSLRFLSLQQPLRLQWEMWGYLHCFVRSTKDSELSILAFVIFLAGTFLPSKEV